MAAGPVFPAFLKIEHQRDGSARSSFMAEVDSMLGDAERRFNRFSSEAKRQLDGALSVKRNTFGSLDLGVDEMKAAAAAQQARATAAREVAIATAAAAREEGDYSQKARLAIAAVEVLAKEEEQAAVAARNHADALEQIQIQLNKTKSGTDAVVASNRQGTTAQQSVINSTRATRTAFVQLGQQMQDVVVQAQMGTNAFMIFAQQVPQAAFALSGLEDSTNKTQARIGQFATFMAGPWGAAIFAATAVLGPLAYNLLQAANAADDAEASINKMLEKLKDQQRQSEYSEQANRQFERSLEGVSKAADEARKAVEMLEGKQRTQTEAAIHSASAALKNAQALREEAIATLEAARAYNEKYKGSLASTDPRLASQFTVSNDDIDAQIELIKRGTKVTESLESSLGILKSFDAVEKASRTADQRINDYYDKQIEKARKAAVANNQVGDALNRQVVALNKLREADLKAERERSRSGRGPSDAASANLGDMTALLKQTLPGVRITSTTGGKHTAGSDHYKGRAIDFVPAGGMGQFTKAQMRQILLDAGVDIRRNANGVEQFFGPGDKGHSDHFHLAWEGKAPDPERVAAAAAKAQQALREMGERASESIMRISERFDEQPRLIDQVAQSTRQLNDIIADLEKRQPIGWEKMVAEARKAQQVVADAINQPFKDYMRDQEQSLVIQGLIASGREDEAAAMQVILRLYESVGVVTAEQQEQIRGNIEAEKQLNEVLEQRSTIINAYVSSISSVRSDLESLLGGGIGGKDFLKNLKKNFQQLQGRLLTEQMFGPMLRALEDQIRKSTGIQSSLDVMKSGMENAGSGANTLANALERAAQRVDVVSISGRTPEGFGASAAPSTFDAGWQAFLRDFDSILNSPSNDNGEEIVVTANKKTADATAKMAMGVNAITPEEYAQMMAKVITAPLASALADLGINISGTLSGALAGNTVGGIPGAIVGGLRGFMGDFGKDIFGEGAAEAIMQGLDGAMKGIQMGTQAAGLMKALGIKTSTTGAQIGGAIGSFIPIPGGQIIGSVLGGLVGGLFKTARTARANITGIDAIDLGGKDKKNYEAANSLADSVISGLKSIADTLDAEIGSFNTTIGVRDKKYRVNANGTSLKTGNGAVDFGDDAEAAVKYAIADAIKDGALMGLRATTQALLQMGDDIEAQIQKALDFENVFTELKRIKNPVGAAIDEINKEFERLIKIFGEAGATAQEWAQLEELYGIKRAEAIKAATEAMVSSLQDLYDFLSFGDSGLSLRDRDKELRTRYAGLKSRVEAGDTTAFDEYSKVGRELLDVERQLYGSTQAYFDLHEEMRATTQAALDRQKALANAAANSDNPFSASTVPVNDNTNVVEAVNGVGPALATVLAPKMDATNGYLATLTQQNGSLLQAIRTMFAQNANTGSW